MLVNSNNIQLLTADPGGEMGHPCTLTKMTETHIAGAHLERLALLKVKRQNSDAKIYPGLPSSAANEICEITTLRGKYIA